MKGPSGEHVKAGFAQGLEVAFGGVECGPVQEKIDDIANSVIRMFGRMRIGTGMDLLRHLVVHSQASHHHG